mmetsp:Transcript_21500/g.34531  ORF Transcript_21500/g.34531 Transcript_21500/m.34531 type:complete len:500 (-) Transcript_21500:99-1598(-)
MPYLLVPGITELAACSLFGVTILVLLPLCIWFIRPMYQRRALLVYKKRYVGLSLACAAFFLLEMVGLAISSLCMFEVIPSTAVTRLVHSIVQIVAVWASGAGFMCIETRFWLVFYETNINILMAEEKWCTVLDMKNNPAEQSFFLRYNQTLGNYRFLCRFLFVCILLHFMVSPVIVFLVSANLSMILYPLLFILFMVLHFKTRNFEFYDEFYILAEVRWIGVVLFPIAVVWIMAFFAGYYVQSLGHAVGFVVYAFSFYVVTIVYIVWLVYTLTKWVCQKMDSDPLMMMMMLSAEQTTTTITTALEKLLAHRDAFRSFMNHVSHEYSMECALSLIEFVQFKQMVRDRLRENGTLDPAGTSDPVVTDGAEQQKQATTRGEMFASLILAECVPRSSIIADDTVGSDDNIVRVKATKLYNKYIKVGSEWEINICSDARQQMTVRFDAYRSGDSKVDLDWSDAAMYHVFDDCLTEMWQLLKCSFGRFMRKAEYQRLQSLGAIAA